MHRAHSRFVIAFALAVGLSLAGSSCARSNNPGADAAASKPDVLAQDDIRAAFAVVDGRLSIHRSALDKEFLLQASLISQPMVPTFDGLRSRVVAFREQGGVLYLLEATQGHTLVPDFPQHLLLTRFTILQEQDGWLTFDFAYGMSRIFAASDWYSADRRGTEYTPEFSSVPVSVTLTDQARIESSGDTQRLVVHQWAQLYDGEPVEVRYYLAPYRPNRQFFPTESPGFKQAGYFTVRPQIGPDGVDVTYVSKFDHSQPIVFAMSSNTPNDFREAVREGILYWNKAFGHEALQVVDAPAGVFAPDPNYNVVQWVDWDDAGSAYADAQMDPRTGEILHAQVFMTSMFAVSGKERARRLLGQLERAHSVDHHATRDQQVQADHHRPQARDLTLKGFEKRRACYRDMGGDQEGWHAALTNLLAQGVDDSAVLRASQDYVRETIAHEIGHTLGLRHNFAASIAVGIPIQERGAYFRKYLRGDSLEPYRPPSSSVMDYQKFEEGALSGYAITHAPQALDYDTKAIRALYLGETYSDDAWPLFCTDSQVGKTRDCLRFDMGRSFAADAVGETNAAMDALAYSILNSFILARNPSPGRRQRELSEVALSPGKVARRLTAPLWTVVESLSQNAQLLSVKRQFDYIAELNAEEVTAAHHAAIAAEIAAHGGLAKLLQRWDAQLPQRIYESFEELLAYRTVGRSQDGEPYTFSPHDVIVMLREVRKFVSALPQALAIADVNALMPIDKLAQNETSDALAAIFAQRAQDYILSLQPAASPQEAPQLTLSPKDRGLEATQEVQESITVALPTFAYRYATRLEAAKLLQKKHSHALGWAWTERVQLRRAFDAWMETLLQGADLGELKLAGRPRAVQTWILQQREIRDSL